MSGTEVALKLKRNWKSDLMEKKLIVYLKLTPESNYYFSKSASKLFPEVCLYLGCSAFTRDEQRRHIMYTAEFYTTHTLHCNNLILPHVLLFILSFIVKFVSKLSTIGWH